MQIFCYLWPKEHAKLHQILIKVQVVIQNLCYSQIFYGIRMDKVVFNQDCRYFPKICPIVFKIRPNYYLYIHYYSSKICNGSLILNHGILKSDVYMQIYHM